MKPQEYSSFNALVVHALSRNDNHIAFIDDDGTRTTYATARAKVGRLITALAEAGVGPGSAVAGLSQNRSELYLTELAVALLGGRYGGLHVLASAVEHARLCDDGEFEVLVIDPSFADHAGTIMEKSASLRVVYSLGKTDIGPDLLDLADAATATPLDRGPVVCQADTQRIIYTGGTTGQPKGVALSHFAVSQVALRAPLAWQMPVRPVYLATSPITHAAFLQILPTLLAGGTTIFHRKFEPDRWLRAIEQDGVNHAFMVPTMIHAALNHPTIDKVDVSNLETLTYGGSPMSRTRLEEGLERFGQVFVQIYGQTECLGLATALRKEDHDPAKLPHLLTSCGRPVVGSVAGLVNETDELVEPGEVGEIVIRSATCMTEYWKQPDLTAETLRNGWLHTGDIARMDDEGYYYILDRKKDMIVSGGFNIFPREIEDIIARDPAVASVAVFGVPDDKWGETVTAVVAGRTGMTPEAGKLIAAVKADKGSYYAPKQIEFVESMPQTSVGKIDKRALRAKYWTGRERNVN